MLLHNRPDGVIAVEMKDWNRSVPRTFLKAYRKCALGLKPGQQIHLEVYQLAALQAAVADELVGVGSVRSLILSFIRCNGDATPLIPALLEKCPLLDTLAVDLKRLGALDFVSSVLESGLNIRNLSLREVPSNGDFRRFENALRGGALERLDILDSRASKSSPEYFQCLTSFLRTTQLQRLCLGASTWSGGFTNTQVLYGALSGGIQVQELVISGCLFRDHVTLSSPFVRKLIIRSSEFELGVAWDLPNLEVLMLGNPMRGVDMNVLTQALSPSGSLRNVRELRTRHNGLTPCALQAARVGTIQRLHMDMVLQKAEMVTLVHALTAGHGNLKEIRVTYHAGFAGMWEAILKSPRISLTKLTFFGGDARAARMCAVFSKRQALLALLQGQQVRRFQNELRRLPVEMFRMVGAFL